MMRPYDCARSAAPSADQSRAQFFSTYLQRGSSQAATALPRPCCTTQQQTTGCLQASTRCAPHNQLHTSLLLLGTAGPSSFITPPSRLAPGFVMILRRHCCPHLVLVLISRSVGGRQVGRRPAALLFKHGQHRSEEQVVAVDALPRLCYLEGWLGSTSMASGVQVSSKQSSRRGMETAPPAHLPWQLWHQRAVPLAQLVQVMLPACHLEAGTAAVVPQRMSHPAGGQHSKAVL